jgi:chromosome partitioning protein
VKSIVLFNNKGGVGKTTLTFNIAHMMAREGWRVAVLDYDPQCNLTAIFLDEEQLMSCWQASANEGATVAACLEPVRRGKGDIIEPKLIEIEGAPGLWLLPGHLSLSRFEQTLAEEWPKTMSPSGNERALDVTNALDLLSNLAAAQVDADVLLVDVGPSLGALNRAALLACDHVILPLAPDLFSLQGLENVGLALGEWRTHWQRVRDHHLEGLPQADHPPHDFMPLGYIMQQHLARVDRPVTAYARWAEQIPGTFREKVLGEEPSSQRVKIERDPHCIARIKHFASLVPYAQQARKPMFDLRRADGVSGGQTKAVLDCRREFQELVAEIAKRAGIPRP